MEADGWVTRWEEQAVNWQPRRVYSVTDEGRLAFEALLRENLATSPQFSPVTTISTVVEPMTTNIGNPFQMA